MGSGCIDPHFLDLGTSWRLVNFTSRPLYPRGKSPRYPLDRRFGGPQSRSGRFGEQKILDPTGTRILTPSVVQPVASRYTDYARPAPENRVLRRIFGPKRDEVTGGWRKLHNEELHNLYSSPSVIRKIKSRRMR
jgi:hypothetical protein